MLRGAPVEVNTRRVTQIVSSFVAITLAVVSVTLFLSGLHHNTNISNLKNRGVLVSVTVTTCTGDLGGSGSTLADYRCEGTFILNGQRFHDTIPGRAFRATGSKAVFVTAKNNPSFLATSRDVRSEKATWRVYTLPSALLAVLIAFGAVVARVRTRRTVVS